MTVAFIGKRHESKAFYLWFTILRFYQISGYMTLKYRMFGERPARPSSNLTSAPLQELRTQHSVSENLRESSGETEARQLLSSIL